MFEPGRETEIKALGKTWRVGRLTLGVIEEFIAWIKTQVTDPFAWLKGVVKDLPPDILDKEIADAKNRRDALDALDLGDPLIAKHAGTVRGAVHQFYLMLKQNHPEITVDEAFEICKEVGVIEMAKATEAGAGKSEGNAAPPATAGTISDSAPISMKSIAGWASAVQD